MLPRFLSAPKLFRCLEISFSIGHPPHISLAAGSILCTCQHRKSVSAERPHSVPHSRSVPCRSRCQADRHWWPVCTRYAARGQVGTLCTLDARPWCEGGHLRRQWRAPPPTGPAGLPRFQHGTPHRTFACARLWTEFLTKSQNFHTVPALTSPRSCVTRLLCHQNESAGNKELHRTCALSGC